MLGKGASTIRKRFDEQFKATVALEAIKEEMTLQELAEVHNFSWEPYNECQNLKGQIEAYRKRYGYCPEVVCADKIYRPRV